MLLQEKTPVSAKRTDVPSQDRLEALAAIWARQTGRSIVVARADSSGRSPMQYALGVRERAVHTGLAAPSRSESLIHTGWTGVWLALLVGALTALGVFLARAPAYDRSSSRET